MCKNNHHMNKKFRCLLASLIFTAMWNGATIQAQAPIPNAFIFREQALTTPRPGIFSVLRDRIVANGKDRGSL